MFFSERLKSSAPESLSGIGHKQIQNHEGTPKLNVLKRTRWPETILAAKFTFHHAACSMLHASCSSSFFYIQYHHEKLISTISVMIS